MKKTLAAILSILMVFCALAALSSCGSGSADKEAGSSETASDLLKRATEKTNALESYDYDTVMKIKMTIMGTDMDVPQTMRVKAYKPGTAEQKMHIVSESTVMGIDQGYDAYMDSDYMYINMQGNKTKHAIADSPVNLEQYKKVVVPVPEDAAKGKSFTTNANGTKTIELSLTEEQVKSAYDEFIDGITGAVNSTGQMSLSNVKIYDASVKITISADEYIVESLMSFSLDMDLTYMGQNITVKTVDRSIMTLNNPGQPVDVTFPDLSDYTEQ